MTDLPYVPISYAAHDRLLAAATLRRISEILLADENGQGIRLHGRVVDVFSRSGAEFLRLESGAEVRLDRILEFDGQPVPSVAIERPSGERRR